MCRRGAAEGFAIVTKDDDFRQRSFLRGSPPKIIWVRMGNCATADVEAILRVKAPEIVAFAADPLRLRSCSRASCRLSQSHLLANRRVKLTRTGVKALPRQRGPRNLRAER